MSEGHVIHLPTHVNTQYTTESRHFSLLHQLLSLLSNYTHTYMGVREGVAYMVKLLVFCCVRKVRNECGSSSCKLNTLATVMKMSKTNQISQPTIISLKNTNNNNNNKKTLNSLMYITVAHFPGDCCDYLMKLTIFFCPLYTCCEPRNTVSTREIRCSGAPKRKT